MNLQKPNAAAISPAGREPFISVRDLRKQYGERVILNGVSLEISAGEMVAMIGPSGGGKSTLLRCMNGLNTFDSGELRVGQSRLAANQGSAAGCSALREIRQQLGMIFQDFQLFPHMTAIQNVIEAPIRVLGQSPGKALEKGRALLERVGLGQRVDYYPRQLSGGQKQRVAIARALAMEPKGLLCDEITSALDPELKCEVLAVLEDLRKSGMALILVTHEIGFARRAADRVVLLADGNIAEEGPPEQVIDKPKSERTRQFLSRVMG